MDPRRSPQLLEQEIEAFREALVDMKGTPQEASIARELARMEMELASQLQRAGRGPRSMQGAMQGRAAARAMQVGGQPPLSSYEHDYYPQAEGPRAAVPGQAVPLPRQAAGGGSPLSSYENDYDPLTEAPMSLDPAAVEFLLQKGLSRQDVEQLMSLQSPRPR